MSATEGNAQGFTRSVQIRKDLLSHFCRGISFRKKNSSQKPFGDTPHNSDVIYIDMDRIGTDVLDHKGDRISLSQKKPIAEIDGSGINPYRRPDHHPFSPSR